MKPSERIDALASYLGISVKALSERIGLPHPQSLYDIQKGKTQNISNNMAGLILKEFPLVSRGWLLTGEGDMLIGDTPITNNGTNQQVAQNVRGHVTQSVTTDLATTISELTEIIKQSQAIASTSQEIAITAQRQLNSTLNQLTESQNQITTLIDLINRQQDK